MEAFFTTKIKPYTDLIRLKPSALSGIGFILGMWIIYRSQRLPLDQRFFSIAFLGFLGSLALTGAINTFNDIQDLQIDRYIKSERSLPQGMVLVEHARIFAILLLSFAIIVSLIIFPSIFLLVVLLIVLGLLYSVLFQNIPIIKNVMVALLMSSPLFVGAWVANQDLPFSNEKIQILLVFSFLGMFLFEWEKDIGDLEGDIKYGKITLPIILGPKLSAIITFFGLSYVLLLFWQYLADFQLTSFALILIGIQALLLVSSSKLLWNQDSKVVNQMRKNIYSVFAIALGLIFLSTDI